MSGGTDNHLLLVDLRGFDGELTGKVAQEALDRAGITTNKNQIPNDPRGPFVTSGLRVGSAAQTTAGMKEGEFAEIASLMSHALRNHTDESALSKVRGHVVELCANFHPYANFV